MSKENTLMKPIDPSRMFQYDQVRWVVNGEPFAAEVINRPIYDVIKGITDKYYDKLQLASVDGASYIGVDTAIDGVDTVQKFVSYVENNMVPKSRKIVVGDGLRGGGDLTGDVFIEILDTLLTTPKTQTIEGTKVFLRPPLIKGEIIGTDDAVNLGYVRTEIEAVANHSVPKTRKVVAGTGLNGGGQLGEDVSVNLDPVWLMDYVRSQYDAQLTGMITTIINNVIEDATSGTPVSEVNDSGGSVP